VTVIIRADQAPALGDVRNADTVLFATGAEKRKDFSRFLDAAMAAVAKGGEVRWVDG
jgi:hypothetical protein